MTERINIRQIFTDRVINRLLPIYCHDSSRNYHCEGFRLDSINVTDIAAQDFLRALDHQVITDKGGCRFMMPLSRAYETIFWEGSVGVVPRAITLWLEPVITIATVARLHLDYDWPKANIGMQSKTGEFDFMVYRDDAGNEVGIAGEVKKSVKELDQMITLMSSFKSGVYPDLDTVPKAALNAYKKWLGLYKYKAPFFWAVGPGNYTHLLKMSYEPDGNIAFEAVDTNLLQYTSDKLFGPP